MKEETKEFLKHIIAIGEPGKIAVWHKKYKDSKEIYGCLTFTKHRTAFTFTPRDADKSYGETWYIGLGSTDTYSIVPIEQKEEKMECGWRETITGKDISLSKSITCGKDLYSQMSTAKSIWNSEILEELEQKVERLKNDASPIKILDYTTFITIKTDY